MACSSNNCNAPQTSDVQSLNCTFGCEGVSVECGKGGLPKVRLCSSGSSAEIYLHGACITSWKPACAPTDLLFVRPDNDFSGHPKPISGGIPHCFPQFGPGKIQQHGFARNVSWEICSTGSDCSTAHVVLTLKPNSYTKCMWDYDFLITYKVTVGLTKLNTNITIKNTDSRPFEFTTALHSYFRAAISGVQVRGLKGCRFLTKDKVPVKGCEQRDSITFTGFCDCLYFCAPNELQLDNGLGSTIGIYNNGSSISARIVSIVDRVHHYREIVEPATESNMGLGLMTTGLLPVEWPDAVTWSPMDQIGSWREFVCVENAVLNPVRLCACATWSAEMTLCIVEYPSQHIGSLRAKSPPMKSMRCPGECPDRCG